MNMVFFMASSVADGCKAMPALDFLSLFTIEWE